MTRVEIIESVIDRVRPAIQADGGDIELAGLAGDEVQIRLTGACAGCPSADMTLRVGIEMALRRALPGLRVVPEAPSGHQPGGPATDAHDRTSTPALGAHRQESRP